MTLATRAFAADGVSPVQEGERRVVYTMEYGTSQEMGACRGSTPTSRTPSPTSGSARSCEAAAGCATSRPAPRPNSSTERSHANAGEPSSLS